MGIFTSRQVASTGVSHRRIGASAAREGGTVRWRGRAIIVLTLAALFAGAGISGPAVAATSPADDVHSSVAGLRANAGRPELIRDPTIDAIAQDWANQMSAANKMVHSTSEWRSARLPSGWDTNGENIAYGYRSAGEVVDAWMKSTGHRDNILRTSYTRMGVGYVASGNYWVQIFAGYAADRLPYIPTSPVPNVSGSSKVGGTLTASVGSWAPSPVSTTIQWKVNGVAVAGATGATYRPTSMEVGAQVSVTVIGTASGYRATARTSTPVIVTTNLSVSRLAGSDRFAVAASVSQAAFPGTVGTVYVASGANYPDALGAAPAAIKTNAPLLLTSPDALPAPTRSELERLQPRKIVVVGGPASISPAVFGDLQAIAPDVVRIAGDDRFAVSRALARYAFGNGATSGYVSTGLNFPDALSAGSAAGTSSAPVILVNGSAAQLDQPTADIVDELGLRSVKITGGENSVSSGLATSLQSSVPAVSRLAGNDRWAASVSINADAFNASRRAYIATGQNYPDALAGAVLAGKQGAPLFVVPSSCIPRGVVAEFGRLGVTDVVLVGGGASLDESAARLTVCWF